MHKETAIYPAQAAYQARQGQVLVKMHINEQGDVTAVEALSGDDVFRGAALIAARKWKFQPFIRDGKAIPVVTTIPFDFAFAGKVSDTPVSLDRDTNTQRVRVIQMHSENEPPPSTTQGPNPPIRVRVSQTVSQGLLVHKVQPIYPPDAKNAHIGGSVVLRAVIGKDGDIRALHVVSGPQELQQSAMDAVQQWRYKPYFLNGQPVEVDTQITVNYTLN